MFQHTAARRRLAIELTSQDFSVNVSTHSRPKAAGIFMDSPKIQYWQFQHTAARRRLVRIFQGSGYNGGFNTQPPEGGWAQTSAEGSGSMTFQHTAARRRLAADRNHAAADRAVSTHSRPKAAGFSASSTTIRRPVSTHSRPKAAGHLFHCSSQLPLFQHTAARRRLGFGAPFVYISVLVSTHSRPKAAGH